MSPSPKGPFAAGTPTPGEPAPGAPARYVSGEQLQTLLTPAEALRAIQEFFAVHPRESVAAPPRLHLPVPGRETIGLYMPAATPSHVGVKLVHLMPKRRPAVEAEVFLYDAQTGRLLFWGDGKPMTALRTAAVSAAASLRLKTECHTLAVFGAGVQAAAHVRAFLSAYPALTEIHAFTRTPESRQRLLAALTPEARAKVRPPAGADALAGCDIVITTTPAPAPLFVWEQLHPAAHVVAVGSATPDMNELPVEAFLHGAVWVDTPTALHEAGDLLRAKAAGWETSRLGGDLFDLLTPGPGGNRMAETLARSGQARTVFKSVGHAAQDLAVLIHLLSLLPGPP